MIVICNVSYSSTTFNAVLVDPADSIMNVVKSNYNCYIGMMHSYFLYSASSVRGAGVEIEYQGEWNLVEPYYTIYILDPSIKFILNYYVTFFDNSIVDVKINTLILFDSGFKVFYERSWNGKIYNIYNVPVDLIELEQDLLKILKKQKIKLIDEKPGKDKLVKLLIFYAN